MSPYYGSLGVFDSGVGGLTVVNSVLRRNPRERVLYVADQAHVPYGGRQLEEVRGFAKGISAFLAAQGCRAVVMACNISSATALDSVSASLWPLPVHGMIRPAVRRATASGTRIGILATEGTVRSGAYELELRKLNPSANVTQVACPRFVPLVEAGSLESKEVLNACREYLEPLRQAECDTIILGCTHYPFLMGVLNGVSADLWPKPPSFIDPAEEVADEIASAVSFSPTLAEALTLLTSGDPLAFTEQVPRFLQYGESRVGLVRWQPDGTLGLSMAERAGFEAVA